MSLPTQIENPKGLHQRYKITKLVRATYAEGTVLEQDYIKEEEPDPNAEYFVLRLDEGGSDPNHIDACRLAINAYACSIAKYLPQLAKDLQERYPLLKTINSTMNTIDITTIARVCHEANRAFCEANGDFSQKPWNEAAGWQRDSAVKGVEFRLNNPSATPKDQHDAWSKQKIDEGWVYGEVKDAEKKTHPCLVTYEELPVFQRQKDSLFQAIVDALKW